jgi:hypothetical protein
MDVTGDNFLLRGFKIEQPWELKSTESILRSWVRLTAAPLAVTLIPITSTLQADADNLFLLHVFPVHGTVQQKLHRCYIYIYIYIYIFQLVLGIRFLRLFGLIAMIALSLARQRLDKQTSQQTGTHARTEELLEAAF